MGAVMGAVSPAVVVPRMVKLMEEGYGTKKGIPQMILAGASCDDIFVIVLFTTFLQMAQGGHANAKDFINIPISIVSGIVLGCIVGYLLYRFFELAYKKNHCVRNSTKLIVILGMSCLLLAIEEWVSAYVAVSGLLAVVSMACMLKVKSTTFVSKRLSEKFGKLWIAAEVILFVLVGAAVDIRYMAKAGAMALLMIGQRCCSAQSVSASACLVRSLHGRNGYSVSLRIFRRLLCRRRLGQFLWQPGFPAVHLCFPLRSWQS